jgi:hypothetical protein
MQAPIGLDGTIGLPVKFAARDKVSSHFVVNGIVKGNLLFSAPVAGVYAVRLYNANGAMVRTSAAIANHIGAVTVPLKGKMAAGVYLVKISAPNGIFKVARVAID